MKAYVSILRTAMRSGYVFSSFGERNDSEHVCLLRHDVDADLQAASIMAEEERKLGVRSTFFIMTRSPLYNLMSRASVRLIQKIIALGHFIGLHYDQGFTPDARLSTAEWIDYEADMLEKMFHVSVEAVSFHQPGEAVLQGQMDTGHRINTYSPTQMAGFHYASDSNRLFKNYSPLQIFEERLFKKLQLLIHPLWWVYGDSPSTEEAWEQALLSNFSQMQEQLLATEGAYGPQRILSIGR